MNPEAFENDGVIFLKGDASKFTPRLADADTLKRHEEFREKLRQYAPKEYEAIMKQREEAMRPGKTQQTPPDEGNRDH